MKRDTAHNNVALRYLFPILGVDVRPFRQEQRDHLRMSPSGGPEQRCVPNTISCLEKSQDKCTHTRSVRVDRDFFHSRNTKAINTILPFTATHNLPLGAAKPPGREVGEMGAVDLSAEFHALGRSYKSTGTANADKGRRVQPISPFACCGGLAKRECTSARFERQGRMLKMQS